MYKNKVLTLVALASVFLSGCVGISTRSRELIGQPVPTTRIVLDDGTYTTLDSYEGKTVILLFWATLCGHSKDAAIDLNAIAKRYRKVDRVVFLASNLDRFENSDAAKKFIHVNALNSLTHTFSGNDVQDEAYVNLRGELIPYIAIINERGKLVNLTISSGDVETYLEEKFGR